MRFWYFLLKTQGLANISIFVIKRKNALSVHQLRFQLACLVIESKQKQETLAQASIKLSCFLDSEQHICENTAHIGRLSCTFICGIFRFLAMWHSCKIGFILWGDFCF